jgi:hypothetical protein
VANNKFLPAASLSLAAALGFQAPAIAQHNVETVAASESDTAMRDRATNRSLLAALIQKRAEIAEYRSGKKGKRARQARRAALEFLDSQIARVRADIGD